MDPLTALSIGSSIIGGIGSLFGSGEKQTVPPELREIYSLLMQQYRQGLSPLAESRMLQRVKTNLGEEAGALGSLTQARLTRAGAGTGVQQTALNRVNQQRLLGIGKAATDIGIMDEEVKLRALEQLRTLAPMFGSEEFKSQYGQGFQELFGAGLNYLLNRPRNNQQQATVTNRGILETYDTPYGDPYSRMG